MIKIRKTSIAQAQSEVSLGHTITNILLGIPLVKAYANEKQEINRFRKLSDKIAQLQYSMRKKESLMRPLQEIVILAAILILVCAVAIIFIRGKTGEVAGYMVYFLVMRRMLGESATFSKIRASLSKIAGPLKNIEDVFHDENKCIIKSGTEEFKGLERSIDFNRLHFSYLPDVPVLKGVTFSIKKGKTVAIVGKTGVGKSTLIHLLIRFYDCSPNMILTDGVDIRDYTLESIRNNMILVSQDPVLFNDTFRKNLVYGLGRDIAETELLELMKKARLSDLIQSLPHGLDTFIGDRGVKLSGGEKQRLSIARAMLKGAEILILDEATSSLDSKTEKLIQGAIDELLSGKTAIVIAHRLSTITHTDKIVVIEDGKNIEEGPLQELIDKKGIFYELWQTQRFF